MNFIKNPRQKRDPFLKRKVGNVISVNRKPNPPIIKRKIIYLEKRT